MGSKMIFVGVKLGTFTIFTIGLALGVDPQNETWIKGQVLTRRINVPSEEGPSIQS